MAHKELAEAYHTQGFNCAQSVLGAFYQDFGLDEQTALKLATGFGSGMGRLCQMCGALTGGYMVIGLKHGRTQAGAKYTTETENTYRLVRELAARFEQRNGTTICSQLLGLDLNNPQERQRAIDEGLFKTRCAKYVQDAIEILEEIL